MKYIIYVIPDKEQRPVEHAVVFPEALIHAWVARGLRYHDPNFRLVTAQPVAAGFCYFPNAALAGTTAEQPNMDVYMPGCTVVCRDRSESMGIGSRPQDAAIIAKEYSF
jgi:hypothetical protein